MVRRVARAPGTRRPVTPLELLFDLVYVLALGPLPHHLVTRIDGRSVTETAIVALAIVYSWYMTTWAANWLEPDSPAVRSLLIGLMFSSLLMSISVDDAFGARAGLFVVGYLVQQLGRVTFLIVGLRERPLGEHFVNNLVWEVTTGVLWVAGALAGGDVRLFLWGIAVAATYAGAAALHWLPVRGRAVDLQHTDIAAGHLLERLRLFFLIALGETVLTTGEALSDVEIDASRIVAMAVAFAGIVALWWCYFGRVESLGILHADRDDAAGEVSWTGTWTLTAAVLALVGIAVGDEIALAHPGDETTVAFTLVAFGSPALFLAAQVFFLHGTLGHYPRSRLSGVVALVVLGVATAWLPAIGQLAAASVVLVAVAVADTQGASS
jgi:low temperature requirement protein LtrA